MKVSLATFCSDLVPDFPPLGGNRPDCAVITAAAVSLVEEQQNPSSPSPLVLPPDVLDTAMAATCATVIIRSASDVVPPPRGCVKKSYSGRFNGTPNGGRLSCRLEIGCDTALNGFYNVDWYESSDEDMPWRRFDAVYLQIPLPDSITSLKESFLVQSFSLVSVDLRNTKLQTLGDFFLCFDYDDYDYEDDDDNDAMLPSLRKIHLPGTLMTVGSWFLSKCKKLVSIDLRNTKLQSARHNFLSGCERLTEVHLPDTLHTVGDEFLEDCESLPEETVASMKRSIEERRSKRPRD